MDTAKIRTISSKLRLQGWVDGWNCSAYKDHIDRHRPSLTLTHHSPHHLAATQSSRNEEEGKEKMARKRALPSAPPYVAVALLLLRLSRPGETAAMVTGVSSAV
jgi:hypothetical protein